jgi:methylmalonyl-CoA mutase N-terminal domain/subunit
MSTTRAKERKDEFATSSGIELKNHFTPEDAALNVERDLGAPGEFPFTRGVYGRCGNTRVSPRLKSPTADTNTCLNMA